MILENLKMAFASIRASKVRSFLTMLGLIIGVGSVITVIAAGEGVKRDVVGGLNELGADFIQVTPGQSLTEDEEGNQQANFSSSIGVSTLTEQDVADIRAIPTVKAAAPIMIITGIPKVGDKKLTARGTYIAATSPDILEVLGVDIKLGEWLSSQLDDKVVLGAGAAKQLFGDENPVGKEVEIRGQNFKVLGVLETPTETLGFDPESSLSNIVLMSLESGKKLAGGTLNIVEIDVKTTSAEETQTAVAAIKDKLKGNHGGEEDFSVLTTEDFLEFLDTILTLMTSFVAAIAGISLLVGGIGIMNIMLVSVTERTTEIGIRKAVGANNYNILGQFLIEAIVLSLSGGALGVGLALLGGKVMERVSPITPAYTPEAFIIALTVSIAVGIVFGLAPAIKAARKHPIDALRYE